MLILNFYISFFRINYLDVDHMRAAKWYETEVPSQRRRKPERKKGTECLVRRQFNILRNYLFCFVDRIEEGQEG